MRHQLLVVLGHRLAPALAVALALMTCACPVAGQVRVVAYNITDIAGSTASMTAAIVAAHEDDSAGFAVPVGVFVFGEVRSGTQNVLLNMVNSSAPAGYAYALATFTTSGSEDGASGSQALIYRTDLLAEIPSGHADIATGASRNTDRWLLRLQGYDSTAARFYVYGSHLKASTGSANVAARLAGVEAIRTNSATLGAAAHVLYTGDMNFYTNTESGYQAFLAAGTGQAWDPLGTGSWAGAGNAFKHTQSPRDITAGGLVGGGMDDRFDFILPTLPFDDGDGLSYIPGTTRALGNDGQHYDQAINTGNNTYFPGNLARSNALADHLFAASDHIPVIADFRVPARNQAVLVPPPARVIQHAAGIVAQVRVSNAAPGLPVGVAPLAYTVTGSGVLSGVFAGTAALTPAYSAVNLPVATATTGLRTGAALATTASQGAQTPSINLPVSVRVLRPSNPSFSALADVDAVVVTGEAVRNGAPIEVGITISNHAYTADQALLDIDSAVVDSPGFVITGIEGAGIGMSAGVVTVAFDPAGFRPGTYEAAVLVYTSDEDVPGETSAAIIATVRATVGGEPCAIADIDCNGVVNGSDLGVLLANWGLPGASDLNGNGSTDGADLGILLANWG